MTSPRRPVARGLESGQARTVLVEAFPSLESQQHTTVVHLEVDALSLVLIEEYRSHPRRGAGGGRVRLRSHVRCSAWPSAKGISR